MTDFIKTKWWILVIAAVVLIAGSVFLFVHPYGEWTTDKAATCTEDGVSVRKCKICGRKETQPIKAAGHQYSEWSVKQEATCTEDGTLMRICSVCKNEDTKVAPAKGHKFDSWKTVKTSTCKVTGVKEHTCKVCGEKEKEDIALAKHTYKDSVAVAATCTKDGTMKHTCKVCGDSYTDTIKCTGHKWKDATCTSPKKCSVCGKTEGSALGHDYSSTTYDCSRCGAKQYSFSQSFPWTAVGNDASCVIESASLYKNVASIAGKKTFDKDGPFGTNSISIMAIIYDENGSVVCSGTELVFEKIVGESFVIGVHLCYLDQDPTKRYTVTLRTEY